MHSPTGGFGAAVALLLLASGGGAAAQTPPAGEPAGSDATVTWGAEFDLSSRYLWHGLAYSDGLVVWPSAWVSAQGFTATLSANLDPNYEPTFNEFDVDLVYERSVGRLTLNGAFSRYTYRELEGDPGSTSEVTLGAAFTVGPGDVFTTHAIDVEHYRGSYYAEVGYAVSWELTPASQISADASIAFWSKFAEKYGLPSDGPLGPATINVAFEQKITPALGVRPHVTFTRLLDAAARHALDTPAVTYGATIVIGR
jgi:hypothetical protein